MPVSPEVLAIAEAQAAQDRDLLARLIVSGKVQRSAGHRRPGISAFARDIESRVAALDSRPRVNLAIRPKRRSKKGKR